MPLKEKFERNKPLSELSTFGIGGPAEFFIIVTTIEALKEVITYCYKEKLPYLIIGKGSNALFDDRGFRGLIILNKIDFCRYEGEEIEVGAGFSFSLLGAQASRKGFTGLEFASGIPGTVGGAVFMNAGAGGVETCTPLLDVEAISPEGQQRRFAKEEIAFSYRYSSFHENRYAIAAARFQVKKCSEAKQKQLTLLNYRIKTQPYQDKSAGCVFRNHPAHSAGALIDRCGLKGLSQGGAQVSEMHGNFIVNKGGASAVDVLNLLDEVAAKVKEQTGIVLEREVRVIPYELPR
jgi:UDP-N-acetylmuramate dehydrogenase